MKNMRISCAALLIIVGLAMIPAAFALTKKQKAAMDKCDRQAAVCFSGCEESYQHHQSQTVLDGCNRRCNAVLVECHDKVATLDTGSTRPADAAHHGQTVGGTSSPTPAEKMPTGKVMQSTPTPTPHQKSDHNKGKSSG